MTDLGFEVSQEDYGASRVDGMRRCKYELSRVMGMRKLLTVMNATVTCVQELRRLHDAPMRALLKAWAHTVVWQSGW